MSKFKLGDRVMYLNGNDGEPFYYGEWGDSAVGRVGLVVGQEKDDTHDFVVELEGDSYAQIVHESRLKLVELGGE